MNSTCRPRFSRENRHASIPLREWASEVEGALDRFFGNPTSETKSGPTSEKYAPRLDLSETVQGYEVLLDLPGVKLSDLKLEIHDDRLTISGKREPVVTMEGQNYHRVERPCGEFFRSVVLPQMVDQEKIDAHFEDGILRIMLPKSAKNQPRKIEIRGGGNP